jgi:hypothetical protein
MLRAAELEEETLTETLARRTKTHPAATHPMRLAPSARSALGTAMDDDLWLLAHECGKSNPLWPHP